MATFLRLLIAALVDALVKQIPTIMAWWEARQEKKARAKAAADQLAADEAAIAADLAAAKPPAGAGEEPHP